MSECVVPQANTVWRLAAKKPGGGSNCTKESMNAVSCPAASGACEPCRFVVQPALLVDRSLRCVSSAQIKCGAHVRVAALILEAVRSLRPARQRTCTFLSDSLTRYTVSVAHATEWHLKKVIDCSRPRRLCESIQFPHWCYMICHASQERSSHANIALISSGVVQFVDSCLIIDRPFKKTFTQDQVMR